MASAAEIALCALIPLLCIAVAVIWICYCYNRQTLCFQRDEDRTLLYKDSWSQNSNGSCNSPRSLQTSSERDIRKATASVGGARGKLQGESTYIAYTVCNPSFSETAPVGQAVPAQPTLRQTHAFNNYYAADLASGSLINLGVEVPLEYGNPTPISSRSASSLGIQQLVAIPEAIDVPASAFQRHSSVPVVEQDGYLGGAASSAATPPPISVGHSIPTTPNLLQVESTFSYNGSQRDYSSPSVSRRHSSELGSPDNPMPPGWQRGRRRSSMQMPIDHRLIDPRLYETQRTASFDADSVDGDADDKSMLHLTLEFNPVVEELHVKLIQATNLEKRVFSGTSDPYCTATLLPDCIKRQSKVHHKTQNPEFEEKFTFPVLSEDLQDKTIRVKVFDFDQFSRDECTGIMELQLKEIDFEMTPCIDMWRSIHKVGVSDETSKDNKQYGDLMLSLAYLPSAEKLTVTIQKARNLVLPDAKIPDACVKVSLVRGGERVKKKRTSTIGASQHPVFNEALTFNLTHDDARAKDVTVVCHVVHEQNKLAGHQNVELGDVTLGIASSGGEERQHWAEMLSQRVNTPVARWHSLRPSPAVASSAAPAADQLASSEANS